MRSAAHLRVIGLILVEDLVEALRRGERVGMILPSVDSFRFSVASDHGFRDQKVAVPLPDVMKERGLRSPWVTSQG